MTAENEPPGAPTPERPAGSEVLADPNIAAPASEFHARTRERGSRNGDWPAERIVALRALWAEGLSTAEIGTRLGVSKNTVIGKAHRLHLPARPSPIRHPVPGMPPSPYRERPRVVAARAARRAALGERYMSDRDLAAAAGITIDAVRQARYLIRRAPGWTPAEVAAVTALRQRGLLALTAIRLLPHAQALDDGSVVLRPPGRASARTAG